MTESKANAMKTFQPDHSAGSEFQKRAGQRVTVLRALPDTEVDEEVGAMFRVRFADGEEIDAFAEELS